MWCLCDEFMICEYLKFLKQIIIIQYVFFLYYNIVELIKLDWILRSTGLNPPTDNNQLYFLQIFKMLVTLLLNRSINSIITLLYLYFNPWLCFKSSIKNWRIIELIIFIIYTYIHVWLYEYYYEHQDTLKIIFFSYSI